ncbi:hypothetical protein D3C76_820110 [compost metagenome]
MGLALRCRLIFAQVADQGACGNGHRLRQDMHCIEGWRQGDGFQRIEVNETLDIGGTSGAHRRGQAGGRNRFDLAVLPGSVFQLKLGANR